MFAKFVCERRQNFAPRRMSEQNKRPAVTVEQPRRMGLKLVKHNCMVAYVQWLLGANDS